jgi:predicted RNase H-like HicB family nuclease
MLNYKATYRLQMGTFFGRILDFPEATAFGPSIAEVRISLVEALRFAAEKRLRRGEMLPIPSRQQGDSDAYLDEMVSVWPEGGDRVQVRLG